MKKMNIYAVYIDDGENCYKIHVPATNKAEAEKYCEGNGNIIKTVDVTTENPISINSVYDALKGRFGQTEIDIITRCLYQSLANTID